MLITPLTMAAVGALLPFTPVAHLLGFTALPLAFFLILVAMVMAYLALIELAKSWFYAHERSRPVRVPMSHQERHHRRLRRRASGFAGRVAS
jgi:Mg2+-importing ATPase